MRKKVIQGICLLIGAALLTAAVGFFYLWAREYRPKPVEDVATAGKAVKTLSLDDSFSVLTFNLGYCGLSADMDSYFDGGDLVRPPSREIVERNLSGILELLKAQSGAVLFLQEVDRTSKRGYGVDSVAAISQALPGVKAFSHNFLCDYVPYPLPHTIGRVDSGLLTVCPYPLREAKRYALPTPFSLPTRVCQLKRGLLVARVPLADSERELVLVNLHLEAYDDGAGKLEQTKILVQLLEEEYAKGNYCLAGGDFNQTFPTVDNAALYPIVDDSHFIPGELSAELFPDGWSFAADGTVPTSRLNNQPYDPDSPKTQHYVIDGFLLSPNLKLEAVKTLDEGFTYADHNPVLLTVSFAT